MNPAQILSAYTLGKRLFPTPLWWLRFLKIAATGEEGLHSRDLANKRCLNGLRIINRWLKKGLIKKTLRKSSRRPKVYYVLGTEGKKYVEALKTC